MRIIIDIGHPAHVHYFRNFIKIMEKKGHVILVSARDRSIIFYLLSHYKIDFYNRGTGRKSIAGKLFYMLIADIRILKKAIKFKPDVFMSFASPYAAQVSWLMRKPHIVIDDTEHARFSQRLYKPFSKVFLNPQSFYSNFGKKQIRFESIIELFYLHHNYYSPSSAIFEKLDIRQDEKYVLLRFVSWSANHDIGHSGLDLDTKKKLIEMLSGKFKVFISTEEDEPDNFFKPYLIKIAPENIHDVLKYSHFFISESGTMASEAAILGTPVIYINSLPLMGYLKEEKNAGMLFHFISSENVIEKVNEFLLNPDLKREFEPGHQKVLMGKIDITAFLVWFVEKYPDSKDIMKANPDYQYNFK